MPVIQQPSCFVSRNFPNLSRFLLLVGEGTGIRRDADVRKRVMSPIIQKWCLPAKPNFEFSLTRKYKTEVIVNVHKVPLFNKAVHVLLFTMLASTL